jgi:hypothetical protein
MRFRLRTLLGHAVGPAVWIPFFAVMGYGLWFREWYGYMMAAVLAGTVIALWIALYRTYRTSDAELERIARQCVENDE